MNYGLIQKTWREVWLVTLIIVLAVAGIEVLLVKIYPQVFAEFQTLFKSDFMKNVFRALLGTKQTEKFGPELPKALMCIHPLVMILIYGHILVLFTRLPAGETGSGTVDILLSWPVSRNKLFLTDKIICLLCGTLIIILGFTSNFITARFAPEDFRIPFNKLVITAINLACLYYVISGIVTIVTSFCSSRIKAAGIAFGFQAFNDLIDYISEFWEPAECLSSFTLWHYYQPLLIMDGSGTPWRDCLVLLTLGTILYIIAFRTFSQRDICTT